MADDDKKDLGQFAAFVPGAQQDLGQFAQFVPSQQKPRGAIGEILNQGKAGLLVDLPKMAGQAIQWTSDPGNKVYEIGKSIADYAREQELRPDLQPQESQHNVVTNALAAGARMIPQSIVPAVGVGLIASGVGAPEGAALLAGSVLGAAPAGMSQAQDTLEKARAKGTISEADALSAARKTGLIEWGGETLGNYAGGKLFGMGGKALGSRLFGQEAGTAAERALQDATSTKVVKPWLHQLPETIATEVGTEMGQNAGEAYVEQQAGIDDKKPWDAAQEAIAPTLGMTALLAPFGLAGMGLHARHQEKQNAILTAADADPDTRTRLMDQIAPQIEAVDAVAARNFRANAGRAISNKQPITLDASLFDDPNAPPPAALGGPNPPPPGGPNPPPPGNPDDPGAGTEIAPAGAMATAARLANPMMPLRTQEIAQKQADDRTRDTGIPHEVVQHPVNPNMFGVQPVQAPAEDAAAAEAPPAEAAAPAAPEAPAAPVGLQPGDHVQVTMGGVDMFAGGTRITGLSPDGQYAMVEGSPAGVPLENITRLDPAAAAAIDAGAHQAATSTQNDRLEPSEAQKEAGNYKKGPVTLQGLDLSIENPVGSTRKGVDADGTPWETTMAHHYGYIRGTNGADNEHIDAYVGPNPASHHVFVIDQTDPKTGAFDEHKVMLGFNSAEQARQAYDQHYAPDWKGGANLSATTVDGFKDWMKGDTTEPFNPAAFGQQPQAPAAPAPAPLTRQDQVENDPFYPSALDVLRGKTSVNAQDLQTQLNVGFNRASRLLEQMQMEGFLSEPGSDGMRSVTSKVTPAAPQQPAAPAAPAQQPDDGHRKAVVQQAVYQVLGTTSPFGEAPMDAETLDLHLEAMQDDVKRGRFSHDRFAQSDVGRHLDTGTLNVLKPLLEADPAGTLQALRDRIVERNGPAAPAPAQPAAPATAPAGPTTPAAPAAPQEAAPAGFVTAKGSTYTLHEDGTTSRNKAARPEHGKDAGPKQRSDKTVYVDSDAMARLNPGGLNGDWRVVDHGDGTMSLATKNASGQWGIAPSQKNVPVKAAPEAGLHPLELWQPETVNGIPGYREVHPGNPITQMTPAPAAKAAPAKPAEPGYLGDLHQRVLKALQPDQFGGRLTPERLGGILGDPDKPGSSIGTERARAALDALVKTGEVVKRGHSYELADGGLVPHARGEKPEAKSGEQAPAAETPAERWKKSLPDERRAMLTEAGRGDVAEDLHDFEWDELPPVPQKAMLDHARFQPRDAAPTDSAEAAREKRVAAALPEALEALRDLRKLSDEGKREQEGKAQEPAEPIPEEINALFRAGSARGIEGAREEKLVRALMAWGYDASNMPMNMFGRPGDTLSNNEIALQAGSRSKIALLVWTAQAPNGKWGVGISIRAPSWGATEGAQTTSPQFDTRYDAIAYGMQRWREELADTKKAHPDLAGYIDMSFAKMEKAFEAMQPAPASTEKAAPKADAKPAWEQTREQHRQAADRGDYKGVPAAQLNLDKQTALSLMQKHKDQVALLGRLLNAKGGKDLKKVAADILRVHGLRRELAGETEDSLMTRKAPALKELAKRVGVYSGGSKGDMAQGIIKWRDTLQAKFDDKVQDIRHRDAVIKAIRAGKTVPDSVMADYPNIGVFAYERGSKQYEAAVDKLARAYVNPPFSSVPKLLDGLRAEAAQLLDPDERTLQHDIVDAAERILARLRALNDNAAAPRDETEERAWQSTPFAERIRAVLAQLRAAGDNSMAASIENGMQMDAKAGRLNEEAVAFRETLARDRLAKAAAKAAPAAPSQEKVHEYDAKEAKPLILIACADEKLPGSHRAIDLYKGKLFEMLRKWLPEGKAEVYVISAKHGLVHADTILSGYDQKLTLQRKQELAAKGVDLADFKGKNFSEVFIAGSNLYRPLGETYAEQLRAAGFVGPDAKIDGVSGFIGVQRGQFGEYLRKLGGAPAAEAQEPSRKVSPKDRVRAADPFLALIAEHGVSLKLQSDLGLEKGNSGNRMVPGYGPVLRNNGLNLDELAEHARDAGFLTQQDIDNPTDNGGTRKIGDMIRRAIVQREVVPALDDIAEGAQQQATERAERELVAQADAMGIDTSSKSIDEIHDAVRARMADNLDVPVEVYDEIEKDADALQHDITDAEIDRGLDAAFAQEPQPQALTDEQLDNLFGSPAQKARAGQAQGDDTRAPRPGTETAESQADPQAAEPAAEVGDFALSGQSLDEGRAALAAKEAQEAAAAKAEREAARRAEADKERDSFSLTGSDRPADVLAAQGQTSIFDQPAEPATPAEKTGTAEQEQDPEQALLEAQERKILAREQLTMDDLTAAQRARAIEHARSRLRVEQSDLSSRINFETSRKQNPPWLAKQQERFKEVERQLAGEITPTDAEITTAAGKPRRMKWEDLPYMPGRSIKAVEQEKRHVRVYELLLDANLDPATRASLEREKADLEDRDVMDKPAWIARLQQEAEERVRQKAAPPPKRDRSPEAIARLKNPDTWTEGKPAGPERDLAIFNNVLGQREYRLPAKLSLDALKALVKPVQEQGGVAAWHFFDMVQRRIKPASKPEARKFEAEVKKLLARADAPAKPGRTVEQEATAAPVKPLVLPAKLPSSTLVAMAIEHVEGEAEFRRFAQAHLNDLAEAGYVVTPDELGHEMDLLADDLLWSDYGDKPARFQQKINDTNYPPLPGMEDAAIDDPGMERLTGLFPAPGPLVSAVKQAAGERLTLEQAQARLQTWKDEAKRIGETGKNAKKVILSLFDASGVWSQPYADAGYTVVRYDLNHGDNLVEHFPMHDIVTLRAAGYEIAGVIAQPPCTSFSNAGRWSWPSQHDTASKAFIEKKYGAWATRYFDTALDVADTLGSVAQAVIEFAAPTEFYVLENPRGRIAERLELPDARMVIQPHVYGDAYTKETFLYGEFNTDLPSANVSPKEEDGGEGSRIHKLRGTDAEEHAARSLTPEGFAYAWFMANHDRPALAPREKPAAAASPAAARADVQDGDSDKRLRALRNRIDDELHGDRRLVFQADRDASKRGTQLDHMYGEYVGAFRDKFRQALDRLAPDLPAEDVRLMQERIAKPGYLERAAGAFAEYAKAHESGQHMLWDSAVKSDGLVAAARELPQDEFVAEARQVLGIEARRVRESPLLRSHMEPLFDGDQLALPDSYYVALRDHLAGLAGAQPARQATPERKLVGWDYVADLPGHIATLEKAREQLAADMESAKVPKGMSFELNGDENLLKLDGVRVGAQPKSWGRELDRMPLVGQIDRELQSARAFLAAHPEAAAPGYVPPGLAQHQALAKSVQPAKPAEASKPAEAAKPDEQAAQVESRQRAWRALGERVEVLLPRRPGNQKPNDEAFARVASAMGMSLDDVKAAHGVFRSRDATVPAHEVPAISAPGTAGQDALFSRKPSKYAREKVAQDQWRVLKRDHTNLNPEEKAAFDAFIQERPDGKRVLAQLNLHKGTPWARQALEGIFVRQAILSYVRDERPAFQSMMEHPSAESLRSTLGRYGMDGLMMRLEETGYVGEAEKPVNNVSSSFINCNPSEDCAKYCYATGGHYTRTFAVIKAELVTLAVEHNPVEAAKRTARDYTHTAEYENGKALRLFDKGDGNNAWLPYIKALNAEGVRVQIFSKNPEFLRQVPDMNLRLLSIDQSNLGLADANPDLPVAFVYDKSPGQIEFVAKLVMRNQLAVVLPIQIGKRVLTKAELRELQEIPGVAQHICPVDAGIRPLGTNTSPDPKAWNCTKCDVKGGIGCFFGAVTKSVKAQALRPADMTPQQVIAARIQELTRELNELTERTTAPAGTGTHLAAAGPDAAARLQGLHRQIGGLLGELLGHNDPSAEAGAAAQGGRGNELPDRGLEAQPGAARRTIPIAKARDEDGNPLASRRPVGPTEFPVAALQGLLERLTGSWKNAPSGGIHAVASVVDLPAELLARIDTAALRDLRGVYDPVTQSVYLVADRLQNPNEAQFVLAHEVLGHAGLRAIMDKDQLDSELNRLRMMNPELAAAARDQATRFKLDLTTATEEALADWQAEGRSINGWQRFVAKVQAALRRIGLHGAADWMEGKTQAETLSLLARAREAITGEKPLGIFGSREALRYSSDRAPRWTSALAEQIGRLPTKAAPAAQWINVLNGLQAKGVKSDEIEWSGIKEWLTMQGNKVMKDDILSYLADYNVKVEDTIKGEPDPAFDARMEAYEAERDEFIRQAIEEERKEFEAKQESDIQDRMDEIFGSHYVAEGENEDGETVWELHHEYMDEALDTFDTEEKAQAAADEANGDEQDQVETDIRNSMDEFDEGTAQWNAERAWEYEHDAPVESEGTSFENYRTVPGGPKDTYREMLITLDDIPGGQVQKRKAVFDKYADQLDDIQQTLKKTVDGPLADALYAKRNVLIHQRDLEARAVAGETDGFREDHWKQGNVLAHVRFDVRTNPNGETVLQVHEIQSDWAEQGRSKGFSDDEAREQLALGKEFEELGGADGVVAKLTEVEAAFEARTGTPAFDRDTGRADPSFKDNPEADEWNRLAGMSERLYQLNHHRRGLNPAPFVKKTEAWVSLALKRVMTYAAEHGIDHVALPTGQQANDIFSLENRVAIEYAHKPDGRVWLHVTRADNQMTVTERTVEPKELPGIVGKEVADKMMRKEGTSQDDPTLRALKERGEPTGVHRGPDTHYGESWYIDFPNGVEHGVYPNEDSAKWAADGIRDMVRGDTSYLLAGDDLKIGGEPMRKFYDGMVVNIANDLLKKFGGGRIAPLTTAKYVSFVLRNGKNNEVVGRFDNRDDMEGYIEQLKGMEREGYDPTVPSKDLVRDIEDITETQPGFTMTPALVERASRGLPLFSRTPDADGNTRERATPGANVQRLASLLGPQLYGDMADMGPVTVKELYQNAFDALKGSLEAGKIEHGEIDITTDRDTRTITVKDNGAGMTPAIINKAFLTIAGTSKETTRSSGGFGIAKMLFLFGNKNLSLVTVRDGVEARLETTGEQLMAAFTDPDAAPEIVTRPTDAPSGTTVTVTLPESYNNPSTGREEKIYFPADRHDVGETLTRSPLFENIIVRFNGASLQAGARFPKDNFTTFATVKFDWGTARIIVSKQEEKGWGANFHVLSNGLWQFGQSLKENPFGFGGENVPRTFYVNVEPRVKPEEAGYPFALNRKGFSPAVADDFAKIQKYLSLLYGANKAAEVSAGFGKIEYVEGDGSVSAPVQLAPTVDDSARENMLHINEGDKIEVRDGRMTVNGREVPELTPDKLAAVKIDMNKFKIDQSEVDPGRPMIHDNVDVKLAPKEALALAEAQADLDRKRAVKEATEKVYHAALDELDRLPMVDTPARDEVRNRLTAARLAHEAAQSAYWDAQDLMHGFKNDYNKALETATTVPVTQAMREQFGPRFDRFLGDIGRQFMRLRDALVENDKQYARMAEVPVGVSFDSEYYGVHTMVPFRGMFLNPAMTAVDEADAVGPQASTKLIATAMVGTMIHEMAHFREMNHNERFIGEMQRVAAVLDSADNFNLAGLKQEIRSILDRNHDIYAALNRAFRSETVVNRGVKLQDGSAYSARNARAADAVDGAGRRGADGQRVDPPAGDRAGAAADGVERERAGGRAQEAGRLGHIPAAQDAASVRLSRASPQQLARQVGGTLKASTVTKLGNHLAHYRTIGLQFLGRLQLTELYGKLFPQGDQPNLMQSYSDKVAHMDADRNEGGSAADAIVDRWAKLKYEKELARLAHDATRLEIDPSKQYQTGDDYVQYKDLKARYDELNAKEPEAIKVFHEAADMYAAHYAKVREAVRQRIDRSLTAHPGRAALLNQLEREFFSRQVKGIYFPLSRFGDYVIQVQFVGRNPQPGQAVVREAIERAETLQQAEDARARLLKEYPPEQGFRVLPIIKSAEYNAARDSVGRDFVKKLFGVLDDAGLKDPSLQDTLNQLILHSMPDLSYAKSAIHRTGVPGFSQDARRAFAHHMTHGVSYLAKLNYSDQLADLLDAMQKHVEKNAEDPDYEHVKAQQVVDEMVKRHDAYMNPKSSALSTRLTSLGFLFYLGLSPASAITNLLQTPTVALPLLGGKYGFAKAAAMLLQASKLAMRGHNDMGTVLSGDELRAYKEWLRSGLVDITMPHDLAGVASGRDNQLYGTARKVMKLASFMFHHAERFNRQATALAAYRLARGDGKGHEEAYRISVEMTKASHFDYAASNRPRFMQGPVAQVIWLFKQYAQNLIFTFARNAAKAVKGDREAAKTFGGLLVTHGLATGLLGLPTMTMLLGAASMLGGSDDDPWDAEIALRRLFADLFGETAGEILAHGITRPTPFDMSRRLSADNLIFPDVQEGLQGAEKFDAYVAGMLGPVVGIGVNWAKALHQWSRGDTARAIETALPAVAKGPARGLRYYNEDGAKDRNGIMVVDDIGPAEYFAQLLGYSNGRVNEKMEQRSAITGRDEALKHRRAKLLDTYAGHMLKQEDVSEDMAAIQAFNQMHPNRVIAGMHLQHAIRSRLQRRMQAKDGVYLPAKRGMDARPYGDFADGEGGN